MYGVQRESNANLARYKLFCKSQKVPDPQRLLLTQDSLYLHLKRVNYQCYGWKNALTDGDLHEPNGHGWLMKDGGLSVQWCRQRPAPDAILEFVSCRCRKNMCNSGNCNCFAVDLQCIEVCGCCNCDNKDGKVDSDDGNLEDVDNQDGDSDDEMMKQSIMTNYFLLHSVIF